MNNRSSATVKIHYLNRFEVMCHNIYIENVADMKGPIKNSFSIPIDSSVDNQIHIWDAKMHFTSFTSPDMIPTIRLTRKMEMESPDSVIVYMKVDKV